MTDKEKRELWEKYSETKDREIRDKLIIEYSSLVKIVAGRLSMYLSNNIEYEELVSFGTFGLIDSIDKFNLSMNVKFETYASLRIRGSIIDQIRKLDWIPRAIRDKQKLYNETENRLTVTLGRKPNDTEMIQELNVSEDEYYLTQSKLIATNIIYIDDDKPSNSDKDKHSLSETIKQSTFINPEDNAIKNELSDKLKKSLEKLTDRERQVIELYYYNDLTLKEIGITIGVTESRVSQLHTKALGKLKEHLKDYMELFYNAV